MPIGPSPSPGAEATGSEAAQPVRLRRAHGEHAFGGSMRVGGRSWGALRGRALVYVASHPWVRPPDVSEQDMSERLTAVLAEATGQAGDGPRDLTWNEEVSQGLGALPSVFSDQAFTGRLPGVDPAGLTAGATLTVEAPVPASTSRELMPGTGTLYVITRPAGRDISGLLTQPGMPTPTGAIMLAPGAQFRVTDVTVEPDGRRVITVEHQRGLPATGMPSTAAQAGPGGPGPSDPDGGSTPGSSPSGLPPTHFDAHPPAGSPSGPQPVPGSQPVPGPEPVSTPEPVSEPEGELSSGSPGRTALGSARFDTYSDDEPASGARTAEGEVYSPSLAQRSYLTDHRLQVRWVPADGDCSFAAVVATGGALLRYYAHRAVPADRARDGEAEIPAPELEPTKP
jgi:hypothetical protein